MQAATVRSLIGLALCVALSGCTQPGVSPGETPVQGSAVALVTPSPSARASQALFELGNGSVVDQIRVGMATDCVPDPECSTRLTIARDATVKRHGIAPDAIGQAHFYTPYIPPGATLGSGGGLIVVFDLADGLQAAVHTFCMDTCFAVAPQPVQPLTLEGTSDHGPLVDPFVTKPVACASADRPRCDDAVRVAIDGAAANRSLTPSMLASAHYYVVHVAPGSPAAATTRAEYIIDIYIAGDHDVTEEWAVGVACGSGPCQVVPI